VEFFRSLYPAKPVDKYLKRVTRLQGALGHLNDVTTATTLVADIEPPPGEGDRARWSSAAGKLIGWHARGLRESEPELIEEWESFTKAKPFWRAA
jgi:triphosphatase